MRATSVDVIFSREKKKRCELLLRSGRQREFNAPLAQNGASFITKRRRNAAQDDSRWELNDGEDVGRVAIAAALCVLGGGGEPVLVDKYIGREEQSW